MAKFVTIRDNKVKLFDYHMKASQSHQLKGQLTLILLFCQLISFTLLIKVMILLFWTATKRTEMSGFKLVLFLKFRCDSSKGKHYINRFGHIYSG
jgi:ABC-type transport system involved in cytochrome c biogenesis permease subunit